MFCEFDVSAKSIQGLQWSMIILNSKKLFQKIWTKLAIFKTSHTRDSNYPKRQVWSGISSESGRNLPFRTIKKWIKPAF